MQVVEKVHVVRRREDPNQLCSSAGSWLIARTPFTSRMVSKAGSLGRIQDAAGHMFPAGVLLPRLPRKGRSLPYRLSSAGISQAAGWCILSPPPLLLGHSASCKPGLRSAVPQGSRYKGTFPCHLLTVPLGPAGIWNGNVPPLLCPSPEPQTEAMLSPESPAAGKGHGCPTPTSKLLPRVLCSWRGWATHPQAAIAGLARGKRSAFCPPRLMLCSLSACSAVLRAGCHAQGRLRCLHEYPDGSGRTQVWMGPMVAVAVRVVWGGGHWQRLADAPGISFCRVTIAPGPRLGCALHCVPRECSGPGRVRPWEQGVRRAHPSPPRCAHTPTHTHSPSAEAHFCCF